MAYNKKKLIFGPYKIYMLSITILHLLYIVKDVGKVNPDFFFFSFCYYAIAIQYC